MEAAPLRAQARGLDLPNLEIHAQIGKDEINEVFARADALLVHLTDHPLFTITVPSKIQAYLATGRPIAAGIAGEAAQLLVESEAALVVPPGDPGALAKAIATSRHPRRHEAAHGAEGPELLLAQPGFPARGPSDPAPPERYAAWRDGLARPRRVTQTDTLPAPGPALVRVLPVVAPAGVTRLPLILAAGYIAMTFLLFLIWPIDWPIYHAEDRARLIAYVALCLAAIGAMSWTGSAGATRVTAPLPFLSPLLVIGAAAALLLLAPTSYTYTGRPPWAVLDALRDQGAAYKRLQTQLSGAAGQHLDLALLRAALAPFIYAVLPLGLLHWRTIGWTGRVAVALTAACSVVFSISAAPTRRSPTCSWSAPRPPSCRTAAAGRPASGASS